MGFFYVDESIRSSGGFIVAAAVYFDTDPTDSVETALLRCGYTPQRDEYKSGTRTDRDPSMVQLRSEMHAILRRGSIALCIVPLLARGQLGRHVVDGLQKVIAANADKIGTSNEVYLDEGIVPPRDASLPSTRLHSGCDSKTTLGIQVADLAAYICGTMLMEHLGLISKTVKAGEGSGYDPDLDIELGFELWAGIRGNFFDGGVSYDPEKEEITIEDQSANVSDYGLYIAPECSDALRDAAEARFGSTYMGCIH